MSKTFVISDTHFGHENIIRYCSRPFRNSEEMDEEMIRRWNDCVEEDDIVYFLGDFAMGPGVDQQFILATLERLNGKIKTIIGNHDKGKRGLKRTITDNELEIEILQTPFELDHEGITFVMTHYPIDGWVNDGDAVHLHGHVHTRYSFTQCLKQISERRYDVGVDMYGGPVELTGDLGGLNYPMGWLLC
jgi:calcineurin-like phosphoesterase family protein